MRIGVDEAGKGPVLGSMFVAAVRAAPPTLPAGVTDSKRLDHERRTELAAAIRQTADTAVVEVPVERIDAPETDMGSLTVTAHGTAVDRLATGDDSVVADAADPDADRFRRRLADALDTAPDLRATHRADETDTVVAAASIIAKVAREAYIDLLAAEYGAVGSGYPSDETTRSFLRSYVEREGTLPACARQSWQTSTDVLAAREQASLDQF
jgi:RNase HII (EC 3.1.26.4)